MSTPLYDALKEYAGLNPLRFHMPGHKGKFLPVPELVELAALDATELPPTGNLYEKGEPFNLAQKLWADIFGFDQCQFLTGGSTMGVHTGLSLCARPGSRVLVDRSCHRAVFNTLALLDLEPVWLERPWLSSENLIGPVSPELVEEMLDQNPDIKTVCITSPTYAGILSEIEEVSQVVHTHGGKLFVDAAHGAHLPFLGDSFSWGTVDALAASAHKTLPAMGQTALLFTNGMDPDRVRQMASVYGSSSPSYPMMVSLDAARQWMEEEGIEEYRRAARWVSQLRERFPALKSEGFLHLDPCRLVLKVKDGGAFSRELEKRRIYPEMEDRGHVVLICTGLDSDEDFRCLERALEGMQEQMGDCPPISAPFLPEQALSLREALFSPSQTRTLKDCEGKAAACQIAPYPPGIPVVAPGERITKKELAYLKKIGYNILSDVRVVGEV